MRRSPGPGTWAFDFLPHARPRPRRSSRSASSQSCSNRSGRRSSTCRFPRPGRLTSRCGGSTRTRRTRSIHLRSAWRCGRRCRSSHSRPRFSWRSTTCSGVTRRPCETARFALRRVDADPVGLVVGLRSGSWAGGPDSGARRSCRQHRGRLARRARLRNGRAWWRLASQPAFGGCMWRATEIPCSAGRSRGCSRTKAYRTIRRAPDSGASASDAIRGALRSSAAHPRCAAGGSGASTSHGRLAACCAQREMSRTRSPRQRPPGS